MQKMLCPFCDHVIKGKGKCDYCGSWVKKPVVAKTSAEFNAQASADPNQCDCSLHSPKEHPHDDTYRDSEDISYQADYNQAYGTEKTGGASVEPERKTASGNGGSGSVSAAAMAGSRMGAGQTGAPRRAVRSGGTWTDHDKNRRFKNGGEGCYNDYSGQYYFADFDNAV